MGVNLRKWSSASWRWTADCLVLLYTCSIGTNFGDFLFSFFMESDVDSGGMSLLRSAFRVGFGGAWK